MLSVGLAENVTVGNIGEFGDSAIPNDFFDDWAHIGPESDDDSYEQEFALVAFDGSSDGSVLSKPEDDISEDIKPVEFDTELEKTLGANDDEEGSTVLVDKPVECISGSVVSEQEGTRNVNKNEGTALVEFDIEPKWTSGSVNDGDGCNVSTACLSLEFDKPYEHDSGMVAYELEGKSDEKQGDDDFENENDDDLNSMPSLCTKDSSSDDDSEASSNGPPPLARRSGPKWYDSDSSDDDSEVPKLVPRSKRDDYDSDSSDEESVAPKLVPRRVCKNENVLGGHDSWKCPLVSSGARYDTDSDDDSGDDDDSGYDFGNGCDLVDFGDGFDFVESNWTPWNQVGMSVKIDTSLLASEVKEEDLEDEIGSDMIGECPECGDTGIVGNLCDYCESGMIYLSRNESESEEDDDNTYGKCQECGGIGMIGNPCVSCEDSGMIYEPYHRDSEENSNEHEVDSLGNTVNEEDESIDHHAQVNELLEYQYLLDSERNVDWLREQYDKPRDSTQ